MFKQLIGIAALALSFTAAVTYGLVSSTSSVMLLILSLSAALAPSATGLTRRPRCRACA